MNKIFICFQLLTLFLLPFFSMAQRLNKDNLADSALFKEEHKSWLRKSSPYLASGMLFSYGLLAANNNQLGDLNKKIREEILEERVPFSSKLEDKLQNAPAGAVFILNAIGVKGKNNFNDRLMIYGLSYVIMKRSVTTLKNSFGRLRPDHSDRQSFPSGHTTTAFAAAEFMRQEYKGSSPVFGIAAYTAAAATGALRMYHNKHWLSDVVAGAGLGIASTNLAYFLYPKVKKFARLKGGTAGGNLSLTPTFTDSKPGISLSYHP